MNTATNEMNTEEETQTNGSRTADKFVVRLPKGMRQLIHDVSKNYHRSMNSEIVSRLESSLRTEPCLLGSEGEESINSVCADDIVNVDLSKQEFAIIERIRKLDASTQEAFKTILSNSNAL